VLLSALTSALLLGAPARPLATPTTASERETAPLRCTSILSREDRAAVAAYRKVVRRYRDRHEAEALTARADQPSKEIGRAVDAFAFLAEHRECLEPNGLEVRDVEAAALLETDLVLAAEPAVSDFTDGGRDLNRAEKLMAAATRGGAQERRCRWMQAVALYYHGGFALESAASWYERSLAVCPEDAYALVGLGLTHEGRGTRRLHGSSWSIDTHKIAPEPSVKDRRPTVAVHLAQAERCYRRALQMEPEPAGLRLRLARIWQAQGKLAESAAELSALLARPSLEPGAEYLGNLLLGATREAGGRYEDAAGCYRAALVLRPRAQVATIALSHALHRAGARREASQILEAWLENTAGAPPADIDDWLDFQWGPPARAVRPQEWLLEPLRQELAR
jgi:tetratricopeptide (TPR) repeat protein